MENNNPTWLKFLLTKIFYKNIFYSIGFVVILIVSVLIFLRFYTRHDKLIELPDLQGLNIYEADSVLQSYSLNYVVIDSVFNIEIPPLSVIDQNPKAGSSVKENRRIYLTIVSKKKKEVQLPNLVDLTLRRAISKLKSIGLSVGNLSFVPDMAKNVVLTQSVNGKEVDSGTFLTVGSTVDLVIGNGLSDVMVNLPNLNGLTKEDAEILLQMNSINLGLVLYDDNVKDSSLAVVYRQRPTASENKMINLGRNVDIYLKSPNSNEEE
ncbi:PASTA domain-containing protein [Flavobacteriales bacterium]|nr:PASTA domain-containing protein [Flavobacteriales bacterium]